MRPEPLHTANDTDKLYAVAAAAAEVFTSPPRRAAALSYLRQRGIDPAALSPHWQLGYAPPGWTRLVDTLAGQFGEQSLLDAGLAKRSSRGALIDVFRDRVIFPIHDVDGRVAGFVGRDLSGHPDTPKYLNTAQNPIFHKGSLLYGLREGRATNPAASQPVVVEGPLDVLAIAARRHPDLLPVAASGTAFTDTHARLAAAAAAERQAVVAMDADPAGRFAATLVGERLRRAGVDVHVAMLPAGTDPADYLARSTGAVESFTHQQALPLLALHVEQAVAAQGDRMRWVEGRLAAARSIATYLATYPPAHAAAQIGWIAHTLDIDSSTFTLELAHAYITLGPADDPVARPRTNSHELAMNM
jgi:DNA primase